MKKLISIILLLSLSVCLLASCTAKGGKDDTTAGDTTTPITGPEGFEDVTAPPENDDTTAAKDTTAKDTTAKDTTAKKDKVSNPEEAIEAARKWLGESDPETGYKYAYSYDGIQKDNDKSYHRVRVSWYIEDQERYSLCGYLLIDKDGNITKYSW